MNNQMGAASITLPHRLSEKLSEKAEEMGYLPSKKSGDKGIIRFFNTANALHRDFYEDEMPKEAVEVSAEDIEQLIEKLRRIS